MDFNQIFGFVKDYVVPQWPFFTASLVIGVSGQVAKTRLWTKDRARTGGVWWWGRATLSLHAQFVGALAGVVLCLVFGDKAPAGPGVDGQGQVILYYLGAGAVSSYAFAAFKQFLVSRGLEIVQVDMPGDSTPQIPK